MLQSGPHKKALTTILATGWWLVTVVLLCLPGNNLPQPRGNWFELLYADKWIHIFLFGILAYLACRATALYAAKGVFPGKKLMGIAILCCLYGIFMEFVQKWLIPGRGFEVWDIVADAAGSVLGWAVARKLLRRRYCLFFVNSGV